MSEFPNVKPGDRVRLVRCDDPHTKIPAGTEGTVDLIDDVGTVHVTWDNGARLGMVAGEDEFEFVEPEPTKLWQIVTLAIEYDDPDFPGQDFTHPAEWAWPEIIDGRCLVISASAPFDPEIIDGRCLAISTSAPFDPETLKSLFG